MPTGRDPVLSAAFESARSLLAVLVVFCHRDYARVHLGSALWAPLALVHYLVVGEREGKLPNPFFDPACFEVGSGSRSLIRYLAQPRYWGCRTSARFDPAWYRVKARLPAGFNPLVDFWSRGFDKRYDPAPDFDVGFFRDSVCRDQWDDRRYAFTLFARSSWSVPTTAGALRRSQEAFVSSIAYRVVARAPQKRPHLVFVQAGSGFAARYLEEPRPYDILLNYYEEPRAPTPGADIVVVQNGTKTSAIRMLLARDPDLLLRYDSVLFLDDDITIDKEQIGRLFAIFEARGLDLAQASLTAASECFFASLIHPLAGAEVRPLNAVEIMMPLISRRVLERFGWVFAEGISGWAIDMLLGAKVRDAFGVTAVALIGEIVAAHERPVDLSEGRFYTFLRERGIDAATEAGFLISRYGLDPDIGFVGTDNLPWVPDEVSPKTSKLSA